MIEAIGITAIIVVAVVAISIGLVDQVRARKAHQKLLDALKVRDETFKLIFNPKPKPRKVITTAIETLPPTAHIALELVCDNGTTLLLTVFDTDDYDYNRLCAEELAEVINDSIKQQNTQDANQ